LKGLVRRDVAILGLDPDVTVHSPCIIAMTAARNSGSDIIDLPRARRSANDAGFHPIAR
jgi:hypothetical protein